MEENLIVTTAIINISPESDLVILQLVAEANRLRDYAEKRVIATDADMTLATDDLSIIAKVKKKLIEKKAEYEKPIKTHLDAVKAVFQTILTPIEDADRIDRGKWAAYRAEQARRQAEAEAINREKLELAKREETLTGEHTVDLTPVEVIKPVSRVQTDMGNAGISKIWKFEVTDFALLPTEYKIADDVKIGKVVRATKGSLVIPGVRIFSEDILKVNTK